MSTAAKSIAEQTIQHILHARWEEYRCYRVWRQLRDGTRPTTDELKLPDSLLPAHSFPLTSRHRPVFILLPFAFPSPSLPSVYPRLASPRLASPRLASPPLASPRLPSPRLASPRLASPRLPSPPLAGRMLARGRMLGRAMLRAPSAPSLARTPPRLPSLSPPSLAPRARRLSAARELPTPEETLADMSETLQESPELTRAMVEQMDARTRAELSRAWAACKAEPAPPPAAWQLRRLAVLSGLPMVGFGFMDNLIMILAGDYIDSSLCFALGLSTMCAAGLGNIISDVVGLAAAGPIELALKHLKVESHNLGPSQLKTWSVVTAKYAGRAIGMVLGCLIGMCPLLFPEEHRLWKSRRQLEMGGDEAGARG
ncbi:hypothetical protein AB1Y20_014069 [Prymnesium parvum]|uniref:Transmembrane protein 65 n=1 Tax=Prymnesium parvum TaxID=97485 RepID=A0AB34IFY4_PRYPA